VITSAHGEAIKSWVLENLDFIKKQPNSNPKGHEGRVLGLRDLQSSQQKNILTEQLFPYKELSYIEEELINKYKIPVKKYSRGGIMLVYMAEGYKCKRHTDTTNNPNEYTTRLNVLLSKPEQGGSPIIKKNGVDITIPIKTHEPWICVAGKYEHSTVKTKGKIPRILLSFGYDVPKVLLENLGYI
jgi:hypothetical protein